jgi:AraC-like DNA-binding protein
MIVSMSDSMTVVEQRFAYTDPLEAIQAISGYFVSTKVRSYGLSPSFTCHGASWRVGDLMMTEMAHQGGIGLSANVAPLDQLVIGVEPRTSIEIVMGRERVSIAPGEAFVYPCGREFVLSRTEETDAEPLGMVIPRTTIAKAAADCTGIDPSNLRFESFAPISAEMSRLWRSTMAWVRDTLAAPDSPIQEPLVYGQVMAVLASTMLRTFPNTATATGSRTDAGGAPGTLRRAIEYIESNPHLDITVGDIAKAACITPRGLQHAFRRQLGVPPMAYLRKVRLDQAHQELRRADPICGDTVTAIASRWGFFHPSKFAAAYRKTYGRLPSDTLRC